VKTVEILVFLYNGKNYIESIEKEFLHQITPSFSCSLKYIVTDTKDGTKEKLDSLKANYVLIPEHDFSHSLTREKYIYLSAADIVILLTQDTRLLNSDTYEKLASCIDDNIKFAYLRQINTNRTIEKYTRQINYPKQSLVKNEESIKTLGLSTFFCSDACSAVDVSYFKKSGGYDGKNLPTNEDMYYARKVILGGKEVFYCADTFVNHTHKFSLKQVKKRYFLVGRFFAICPEFKQYNTNKSGLKLAFKVFGLSLKDFNVPVILGLIPNMFTRFWGEKKGENYVAK
jgi:rhamnosyltransferase